MEGWRTRTAAAALCLGVSVLGPQVPALGKTKIVLPPLTPGGTVEVRSVLDGETLALADGRRLRLVDIEVPVRAAGRRAPALADKARQALVDLVAAGPVELRYAGNPIDRHGRVLADVVANGVWVQGALLRAGLARVRSVADERAGVPEMLALERSARRAHRGIWRDAFYAVRRPEDAARYAGSYQIVEGVVADAAKVNGEVFVNFGPDWHTAFSLRIDGAALRLCRAAGLDPLALKGERLRVRGFIDGTTRPTMAITHPEQIEQP